MQPELGSWGDGKGEDELSPEEIQMVMLLFACALGFNQFTRLLFSSKSSCTPLPCTPSFKSYNYLDTTYPLDFLVLGMLFMYFKFAVAYLKEKLPWNNVRYLFSSSKMSSRLNGVL